MASRDETLKLIVQTEGDANLKALSDAVAGIGTQAGIADPQIRELVDKLTKLNDTNKQVNSLISLNSQIDANAQKLTTAKDRVAQYTTEIAANGVATQAQSTGLANAQKTVDSLTGSQGRLQEKAAILSGTLHTQGVNVSNLGEAHAQLGQHISTTSGHITELAKTSAEAAEAHRRHAEQVKRLGEHLLELVGFAAAAEIAIKAVEFGKEQLSGAADVEAIFSRIKATAKDAGEAFGELDKKVEEAAKAVNVSTQVSADALSSLVRNGLTAKESFDALIPTLELAKNANIGVGEASADVVHTLKLFGIQAADTARVVDVLTAASLSSEGGLGTFTDALSKVAPSARELGLDLDTTATLLGVITRSGVETGKASKGLQKIFEDLRVSTSPLRVALSGLGDNSSDFQKAIATAGKSSKSTDDILKSLSGSSRNIFELFLQQGPQAFNAVKDAIDNSAGAASRFSKTLDQNLKGQFKELVNAVDRAGESLAKPILEPLQNELTKLAKYVNDFSETPAFAKLQKAIGEFTTKAIKSFDDFITNVDLEGFANDAANSLSKVASGLGDIADSVSKTAAAINVAATSVGVVYHALGVAVDSGATAAAKGVSQISSNIIALAGPIKYLSAGLIDVKGGLEHVKDAADDVSRNALENLDGHFKGLETGATDLKNQLSPTSDAIKKVGEAAHGVAPKADEAAESLVKFGVTASSAIEKAAQAAALSVPVITADFTGVKESAKDLESAFKQLGIKSAEDLNDFANKSETEFKRINAQQDGTTAKLADAQQAFLVYAKRRLESVKDLDEAAKQQAESDLTVQSSSLRLGDQLDKLEGSILGVTAAFKGDHGGGVNFGGNINDATTAAGKLHDSLLKVRDATIPDAGRYAEAQIAIANASNSTSKQVAENAKSDISNWDSSANHLAGYGTAFVGVSEKAVKAFSDIQTQALYSIQGLTSFGAQFAAAVNAGVAPLNEEIAHQQQGVKDLERFYADLSQTVNASQTDTAVSLQARADQLANFSAQIRNGTSQFQYLDQASLAGLAAQVDAVKQKTQSLANAATAAADQLRALNQQLQDQVDANNNNQKSIEDRRYQTQLQQIKDLQDKTGAAGLAEANQALALAQKVHDDALKKIAEQLAAQTQANNQQSAQKQKQQAASPSPTPTPAPNSAAQTAQVSRIEITLKGNTTGLNPADSAQMDAIANAVLDRIQGAQGSSGVHH